MLSIGIKSYSITIPVVCNANPRYSLTTMYIITLSNDILRVTSSFHRKSLYLTITSHTEGNGSPHDITIRNRIVGRWRYHLDESIVSGMR